MSIASDLSRIKSAKAALKSSIEGKGVSVPGTTLFDGYPALVDSIDILDTSDATATAPDILYDKTAYANGAKLVGEARISKNTLSYYLPHMVFPDGHTSGLSPGMYRDSTDLITMNTNQVAVTSNYAFQNCSNMTSVTCPRIVSYGTMIFYGCTELATATLGSIGYPVTSMNSNCFGACTQSNFVITIYVNPGSQPLANSPWGAVNATIVYRSAVDGSVL